MWRFANMIQITIHLAFVKITLTYITQTFLFLPLASTDKAWKLLFFYLLIDHLHYTFWRPSCQHLGKWNASAFVNGGINAQLGHFYNNHIRQKPHSREFLMGLIEAQELRGAEGYRPKNFNHPRRKLMAH